MESTAEQLPVIQYEGNHLVVKAYAGCGKTSTLVAYAEHHSHLRMLYLAYNRAIRDEGAAKFPRNVVCKTSHQLAWPGFGQRYQHKLGNVRLTDAAALLDTRHWGSVRDALAVLSAYLSSADREIGLAHALAGLDGESFATGGDAHIERTIGSAQRLWEAMIDPQHSFPCQHDAYLKLYQLSRPTLPYDVILFDEAQDSNPVTAALVAGQSARKIFVGDKWQQIYRWRGAENALDRQIEEGADVLYLTQSFRFGPLIAGVANAILALQGETRPLLGFGPRDRVTTRLPFGCERYTVLNRTVVGVIMTAIGAVSLGKAVYWNGGRPQRGGHHRQHGAPGQGPGMGHRGAGGGFPGPLRRRENLPGAAGRRVEPALRGHHPGQAAPGRQQDRSDHRPVGAFQSKEGRDATRWRHE